MSNHNLQPIPIALKELTQPLDWDALNARMLAATGVSPTGKNVIIPDIRGIGLLPNEAYGWFHRDIDQSPTGAGILDNFLAATADEDRLHFGEEYANLVLKMGDADDASYFRRGVWLKENIPDVGNVLRMPAMQSVKQ